MRWWLCVWFLIGVSCAAPVAVFSAQDKETPVVALKELSGTIVQVDAKESRFAVKPREMDKNSAADILLTINSSTVMEKDYNPCDLSKIALGDHADIIYSTDESGKNLALEVVASSVEHTNIKREVSKKKVKPG